MFLELPVFRTSEMERWMDGWKRSDQKMGGQRKQIVKSLHMRISTIL
jgi:hypothetical protein